MKPYGAWNVEAIRNGASNWNAEAAVGLLGAILKEDRHLGGGGEGG